MKSQGGFSMLPYNYTMQPQFVQPQGFMNPTQGTYAPIQYVNGIDSANAYAMQPNQEVILMDSNNPVFYFKKTDASGFSTVKAYEFHEMKPENEKTSEYLTKKEFDEFVSSLESRLLPKKKEGK